MIIHGLQFHHIRSKPPGPVMEPEGELTHMAGVDGDAIRLVAASKVWIDHNTLYACEDGLLDVTRGSTGITVSNNWFRDHDKVMLLGHDDDYLEDRRMSVTVAFNRFGPNCQQRMPRSATDLRSVPSRRSMMQPALRDHETDVQLLQDKARVCTPGEQSVRRVGGVRHRRHHES